MFGLSFIEIVIVVVVAILVFGDRLPTVAAEAATFVTRMKRSLADLRRETGIDREFAEARREIENRVPRAVRTFDLPRTVHEEVAKLGSEAAAPIKTEMRGALDAAEATDATDAADNADKSDEAHKAHEAAQSPPRINSPETRRPEARPTHPEASPD